MQTLHHFPFPVTVQTLYLNDASFIPLLKSLSYYGYHGLEINIVDEKPIPAHIAALLNDFGLRMTWLATGACSRKHGLSLSSPEFVNRQRAIDRCKAMLEWAAQLECGIIIGSIKNNPVEGGAYCTQWLKESLQQVCQHAEMLHAPILLEATNRYESHVCNTLQDTKSVIQSIASPQLFLLPDTFHMNIEETQPTGALQNHLASVVNLHFSDSNRFFPGFGHIDFAAFLSLLQSKSYSGTIGLEGNPHDNLIKDIETTTHFLTSLPLTNV